MTIWNKLDDYPVAEITTGEWGEEYPAIRIKGPSIEAVAEPYMEKIVYGKVDPDTAAVNISLIVKCVNAFLDKGK